MSTQPGGGWDDSLADAVALTIAVREDRTGDAAVLLRHGNSYGVAITLAKLLAEVCEEQEARPEHFRSWASSAVKR